MELNPAGERCHSRNGNGGASRSPRCSKSGRTSVWEKMTWFARRSKKEQSGNLEPVGRPRVQSDPADSFDSGSSSDCDISTLTITKEELARRYPNSEVVEQNCLRPSVARALFQQLQQLERLSHHGSYSPCTVPGRKARPRSTGAFVGRHWEHNDLHKDDCQSEGVCCHDDKRSLQSGKHELHRCNTYPFLKRRRSQLISQIHDVRELSKDIQVKNGFEQIQPFDELKRFSLPHAYRNRITGIYPKPSLALKNSFCNGAAPSGQPTTNAKALSHTSNDPDDVFYYVFNEQTMADAAADARCRFSKNSILWDKSGSSSSPPEQVQHLSDKNLIYSDTNVESHCKGTCKHSSPPHLQTKSSPKQEKNSFSFHRSGANVPPRESSHGFVDGMDGAKFKVKVEKILEWFDDFSDDQRNMVLKRLLEKCEASQMHLLSNELGPVLHKACPPNCQDLLSWLPLNLAHHIFSFLDPVSLCHASFVCKRWYQLASDSSFWRQKCHLPKWRLFPSYEQKQIIKYMLPDGTIEWKRVFSERYKLRRNWLTGSCNVRTFEGHTQGISCVQFDDTRIVSGSTDNTIKVWNIRTNSPWSVLTLAGHSGAVRCLHLEGNRLVSGSVDCSIKVWDLSMQSSWSSIACRVTMIGHTDTVRCLQVDDERVVSGSYDRTLKVWDIRTGQCQHTLSGHEGAVLCVQFDRGKIVSGSWDKSIKVWNLEGACLMTLRGHQDSVTCLQYDAHKIISGSLDCNIKFWDITTGECIGTLDWTKSEGHTGVVRCLQADSWRIVSAADDRTIKVWDLETGERLVTLRNHSDGVTCLQFNDHMIVSGSYDKTVKLWDFSPTDIT